MMETSQPLLCFSIHRIKLASERFETLGQKTVLQCGAGLSLRRSTKHEAHSKKTRERNPPRVFC